SPVVHGLSAHPASTLAGMRQLHADPVGGMVSPALGGDGTGAHRATPQPREPARGQTQNVEVRQKATRASPPTSLNENLCRDSGYHLTNGIGVRREIGESQG